MSLETYTPWLMDASPEFPIHFLNIYILHPDSSGIDERHAFGHLHCHFRRYIGLLTVDRAFVTFRLGRETREGRETWYGCHPISDLEAGYALANRLNRSCAFGTQRCWVFVGRSKAARAVNDLQPVESDYTDLQPQLARCGILECNLFEAKYFWTTEFMKSDNLCH